MGDLWIEKIRLMVFFENVPTQPKSSNPQRTPPAEIAGLMIRAWIWGGGTSRGGVG